MVTGRTIALNIILYCAVLLLAAVYLFTGNLPAKAGASICFVVIAAVNFFATRNALREYRAFSVLLLCGLGLAMAGDIVINHIFVAGTAAFAVGHILFFAAQRFLCPPDKRSIKRDIICAVVVFSANMALLMFAPLQFRNALMIAAGILYAVIISVMTGKAISNYIGTKTPFFLYMLVGTGLFMVSDILLALYGFMGNLPAIHLISLTLYYISVIMLADSFLLLAKMKN